MRKLKVPVLFLFMVLVVTANTHASTKQQNSQPAWLSGVPPTMETMKKLRRSHGGYVLQDKDGLYLKMLWLRKSADLNKSAYNSSLKGSVFLLSLLKGLS
ncbi:MAG: hypothetical protein RPT00_04915 [Gammaproteobacteria bacterium]